MKGRSVHRRMGPQLGWMFHQLIGCWESSCVFPKEKGEGGEVGSVPDLIRMQPCVLSASRQYQHNTKSANLYQHCLEAPENCIGEEGKVKTAQLQQS